FRVEINKDVAQKDKVEFTNRRERLIQVDLPEHQTLTQFRSNEERSVLRVHALQAKARQVLGRNVVGAIQQIMAFASTHQHTVADVRPQQFPAALHAQHIGK